MAAGNVVRCWYSDPDLNQLLAGAAGDGGGFSRHFNQVEEFFLRLNGEFAVPQLPIHHDVRQGTPEPAYRDLLRQVIEQVVRLAPAPFQELTHLFDPAETLRPAFFTLYDLEDRQYLYLLRLDLMYRPQVHRVLLKGSNDCTPAYSADQLYLEALTIPVERVVSDKGAIRELWLDQTISNTFVEETGRGYFAQGIWMDNDLTRFFTKLFLAPGVRLYPFRPFVCKYKTVCQTVIDFAPEGRRGGLPLLHRALGFLRPVMPEIEASLRSRPFSESDPVFKRLKARVPESWNGTWGDLHVEAYLNERDMKEFKLERGAQA
jgi:hypothetical protein